MSIACKFCFVDGLRWGKDALGKWVLFYESGQRHLCRPTREKIAKKIKKAEFWDLKGLAKWEAKQPKPEPPPEPFDFTHPWFGFLDTAPANPKVVKTRAAKQEVMELIP
jgi:hypothetical protein